MLVCSCGWKGANLVPNKARGTANCPKCGVSFWGIEAKDAVVVSVEAESDMLADSAALQVLCDVLSKKNR